MPSAGALSAAAAEAEAYSLAHVRFYPQRLPLVLGQQGELVVALEAGAVGVDGPLHFAYDPARLEVVAVEGGQVQTTEGVQPVRVTHTPVLGWLTAQFSGTAQGTSTLLKLKVQAKQMGELPLIFAGPLGAATSANAIVVAVPLAAPGASQ
jgi:hypothetical protein